MNDVKRDWFKEYETQTKEIAELEEKYNDLTQDFETLKDVKNNEIAELKGNIYALKEEAKAALYAEQELKLCQDKEIDALKKTISIMKGDIVLPVGMKHINHDAEVIREMVKIVHAPRVKHGGRSLDLYDILEYADKLEKNDE